MIRNTLLLFTVLAVISFGCENKPTESSIKDTLVTDTVAKNITPEVKIPPMTGKSAVVGKKWKASEFETSNVKLSGELIDIRYDFRQDSTFEFSEDGKKETGKWKVDEAGKSLTLSYDDKRIADYSIEDLTDNKMKIAGKEHGMYRTIILEPAK